HARARDRRQIHNVCRHSDRCQQKAYAVTSRIKSDVSPSREDAQQNDVERYDQRPHDPRYGDVARLPGENQSSAKRWFPDCSEEQEEENYGPNELPAELK